jgi:hypothetical protein
MSDRTTGVLAGPRMQCSRQWSRRRRSELPGSLRTGVARTLGLSRAMVPHFDEHPHVASSVLHNNLLAGFSRQDVYGVVFSGSTSWLTACLLGSDGLAHELSGDGHSSPHSKRLPGLHTSSCANYRGVMLDKQAFIYPCSSVWQPVCAGCAEKVSPTLSTVFGPKHFTCHA